MRSKDVAQSSIFRYWALWNPEAGSRDIRNFMNSLGSMPSTMMSKLVVSASK